MKKLKNIILFTIIFLLNLTISFSQISNERKIRTFLREYTYDASELDSKVSSRVNALIELKRLLLEEVGVYIESNTTVENYLLTKDEIIAISAGITETKVLDEAWNGKQYYIKAEIIVNIDDVDRKLNLLINERSKIKELEEAKKKADKAIAEIAKLKKELEKEKTEKEKLLIQKQYSKNIDKIREVDYFNKAYAAQNYNLKIEYYTNHIKINTNDALAYHNRGHAYHDLGKYELAVSDYSKAIELDSKLERPYFNRGNIYIKLGKYELAIFDYSQVIKLTPRDIDAYFNRGFAYNKLGKYELAISDYSKAISHTNDAKAYKNRGLSYLALNKYDLAVADFNVAIERYVDSYFLRGTAYHALGKYELAISDYNEAKKNDSKNIAIYYNLGCVYSLINNPMYAIHYLKKAIELGYNDYEWIKKDEDWSNIRNSKKFQELVESIK